MTMYGRTASYGDMRALWCFARRLAHVVASGRHTAHGGGYAEITAPVGRQQTPPRPPLFRGMPKEPGLFDNYAYSMHKYTQAHYE